MTLYADLFRYGDLFLNLFRRELRVKYRGSVLGLAWTLINPIVLMFGYWLLFSILLRVKMQGPGWLKPRDAKRRQSGRVRSRTLQSSRSSEQSRPRCRLPTMPLLFVLATKRENDSPSHVNFRLKQR